MLLNLLLLSYRLSGKNKNKNRVLYIPRFQYLNTGIATQTKSSFFKEHNISLYVRFLISNRKI